jgi:2-polyprenyl-6-methoxyphenol hydroxylase-like FAD-dependent oxidoreductase
LNSKIQVLIVGAGPTGLVLALCLSRFGVHFRIIDKADEPGTTSRALVVHARTLEFYRQLGIAEAIVNAAQKFMAVNLWTNGKRRAHLAFGDIGRALSYFPYSLIFPQDQHERVLIEALRRTGIEIERGVELAEIANGAAAVRASLRKRDGTLEDCECDYLAGCDGARSTAREQTHIGLPGGTYSHVWYVADVDARGPLTNQEVNISMDSRDVIAVFPMQENGSARLVGQAAANAGAGTLTWDGVNKRLLKELHTEVQNVRWFSTYRVHHRVAESFRKGRVFLLGDAAHLHSPVGGQGMNTGIGDAVNFAWKVASVLQGRSKPELLDSYELERITFARGLVASTDRVFGILNSNSVFAAVFRSVVVPAFMPPFTRARFGRRFAFRLLSQISINYRRSPLSVGQAGSVRAGDRLPWVLTASGDHGFHDNFGPLAAMNWQVHIYGQPTSALRTLCASRRLPLHIFEWREDMRRAKFVKNALYLLRPDGHIALADATGDARVLDAYLAVSAAFDA